MSKHTKHFMNEADIGSGDKTPADHETEKLIEEIGKDKQKADTERGVKQNAGNKHNFGSGKKH